MTLISKNRDKKKKDKLRYNEYYSTQEVFDDLYARAQQGVKFQNLYDIIVSEKNINLDMQMFIDTDGHLKLISLFQLPEGIRLKTVYSLHKEFDDF